MKIQTTNKKVIVTNKDFDLEDTFEITVQILTYKENMSLLESVNIEKQSNSDLLDYSKQLFIRSVIDWKNIVNENNEEIECNNENKAAMFDFNTVFCQAIISKVTEHLEDYKKK